MRLEIEPSTFAHAEIDNGVDTRVSASPAVDVSSLVSEGVAAAQRGDRVVARTLLLQATASDPQNADAWMWLASISEYPEELLVFLNNVLKIEPENQRALEWRASTKSLIAKTFVHRGVVAKDEGQTDFALDCFDKAIENDAECEMAWFWRASMLADEDKAVEGLERVLSINPDNADAAAALDAIASNRSRARFRSVQAMVADGDWKDGIAMLDEFLATDLSNVEAWTLRSHISATVEEKLLSYERILSIEPDDHFAASGRDYLQNLLDAVKPQVIEQPIERPIEQPIAESLPEPVAAAYGEPSPVDSHDAPVEVDETVHTRDTDENLSIAYDAFVASRAEAAETAVEAPAETFVAAQPIAEEEDTVDEAEYVSDDHADQSSTDPFESVAFGGPEAATVGEDEASFVNMNVEVPPPTNGSMDPFSNVLAFEKVSDADVDNVSQHEVDEVFANFENSLVEPPINEVREDPTDELNAEFIDDTFMPDAAPAEVVNECPFCAASLSPQAFSCRDCRAILSLSDVESMLASNTGDLERIHESVTEMEAAWNHREFSPTELQELGIGHLNLKNFDRGLHYLQEASRLVPNDVILSGQVNALAIRLDEMRRQDEQNNAAPKGCSILVVDDSATVRKLISNKLEKQGHTVICAADGVEAMEAIDNFIPELVLLDITMPRMDGYQVCKMIRSHDLAKDVPVVMISGKDGFFDKVRGRMSGCTGYITKPFGPETLMKALDTYLVPAQPTAE